jgi:hypothetical protein
MAVARCEAYTEVSREDRLQRAVGAEVIESAGKLCYTLENLFVE